MRHPSQAVQEVGEKIADHMDRILSLFKPGAKVAVIVFRDGHPDQDVVMTNGTMDQIIETVRRRQSDPKSLASVV